MLEALLKEPSGEAVSEGVFFRMQKRERQLAPITPFSEDLWSSERSERGPCCVTGHMAMHIDLRTSLFE